MWVARDKNGDLRLFSLHKYKKEYQKPSIRDNRYGIWCVPGQTLDSMIDVMNIDPSLFPYLEWEDEPIEVELVQKSDAGNYEELKDKYDALYMMCLSQVSQYKSLYEEEKKKNKN